MIPREIAPRLLDLFRQYPIATITGPRQSGKTTLCRAVFPDLPYRDLDSLRVRDFARSDPVRFLAQFPDGAVLDEIQRVPDLLSELKVLADEKRRNGLFVLTGSEQFRLSESISESLAGRTALLRLLPFSLSERAAAGGSSDVDDILYSGFFPRIHDQGLEPRQALSFYFETYVERDVRRIGEIRNLTAFERFVRLAAGRVGQLLNLSALGADAGVSHTTARHWLSVLEASYVLFRLPPFHANIRKRLVRSPKLYFHDVGLASHLIGIEAASQIATHPLRGPLFENLVVSEAVKHRAHRGWNRPNLSFFRDARGLECDLLYETGDGIAAIEIKSGATVASDAFRALRQVAGHLPALAARAVVYGGNTRESRTAGEVIPLAALPDFLKSLDPPAEPRRAGSTG